MQLQMPVSSSVPLNAHSFPGMACTVTGGCLSLSHSFLTNLPTEALFIHPSSRFWLLEHHWGGRWKFTLTQWGGHSSSLLARKFSAQPVPLAWLGFLKLWSQNMWTNPTMPPFTHAGDRFREGLTGRQGSSVKSWYFTIAGYATAAHVCTHTHMSLAEALVSEQGWVVISRYRWENWLASSRWLSWQTLGWDQEPCP